MTKFEIITLYSFHYLFNRTKKKDTFVFKHHKSENNKIEYKDQLKIFINKLICMQKGENTMEIVDIILIAVGLAMDAFAVAICKGLAMIKINTKKIMIIGLWFGVFQAIMPLIGYYLGNMFENITTTIGHLIAFILLTLIGYNMIKEARKKDSELLNDDMAPRVMLGLAIATSIDALTVGVTFSFLEVNILSASSLIGIITFILTTFGVKIGSKFGNRYEKKAQILGGSILIALGIKNLLEHCGIC